MYIRILRGRFLWYFIGQMVYAFGAGSALVILTLSIFYAFHGKPSAISTLFLLRFVPISVIGVISGPIIRRVRPMRVLQASPVIFALCIIGWSAFPKERIVWGFIAVYHLVFGLFKASRMTALAEMVTDQNERVAATGLLFGGNEAVSILSGAVGAWLYTSLHPLISGAVTAVLVVAGGLIMGRLSQPSAPESSPHSFSRELAEGWRYVYQVPSLRILTVLLILIWASLGAITVMLLYLLVQYWHGGAVVYGWGISSDAIGSTIGMFLAPVVTQNWSLARMSRGLSWLLVGAGLLYIVFSESPSWPIALGVLVVAAVVFSMSTAIDEVFEQTLPTDAWRAQSISAMSSLGTAGYIIGSAGSPYFLHWVSPAVIAAAGGGLLVLSGLVAGLFFTRSLSSQALYAGGSSTVVDK